MILGSVDWIILGTYFIFIFAVGYYYYRKNVSAEDYFLASRKSKWYSIGPTIFAANISSEHVIGLAGSGAAAGLAVGAYEWMAAFCLFVLAWLFIPHYLNSKVFTMPEFLERRYNAQCRWYLSTISIAAYIFTKISVALFAGSILLNVILGWDYLFSSVVLVLAAGLYTAAGGLSAVIFTDMFQTAILIIGSVVLTLLGLAEAGGFEGLRNNLPEDFFHMIKPASDKVYPWTGTIFGIFILGIWYWATDQFIVQKALSAKNINHARAGINFTALLKILPVFILVLPGLIARSLWGDELASSPDQAYPMLVTRLLPAGLSGLMIAALLAALISSLAAVFNSSSTLFTMDIYKKLHPNVSDRQMVKVGRLATLGIIVIGIMWIPLIRHMSNQLYQYLQSVQAYISPPIAAVFLAGILWRKATSKAAITTLIAGGVLGLLKFAADIISKFTENEFIADFASISFLNYCVLLFLFCVAMIVVISKLSAGAESKDISRIIITDLRKVRSGDRMWNIVNVAMSVMIALTIISLWYHFA
jgi:solute:Na+ symporter, SSS family